MLHQENFSLRDMAAGSKGAAKLGKSLGSVMGGSEKLYSQ